VLFNRKVWKRLTEGRSSRQHESQYGDVLHRDHPQFDNRKIANFPPSRDIIPPPDMPSMDPMGCDGEVRA
jgi:hypothetical protein